MKKTAALIYRTLLVLGCAYGLFCNLFSRGRFTPSILAYYTLQSNIVCLLFFLFLIVAQLAKWQRALSGRLCATVKCACTMCILVTGLVFHFVLSPQMAPGSLWGNVFYPANFFVHTFTPAFVLLDYFLFDAKGRTRFTDPLLWMSIPYAYLLFVYVYKLLGGRFAAAGNVPYFFLDTQQYGVGGVILWLAGITIVIVGLWMLFVLLDHALGRRSAKRAGCSI